MRAVARGPEDEQTRLTVRPSVLLFDIDGTLITTGGLGRRALEQAFAERYGSSESLAFSFGGMTDRAIVRAGLRGLGVDTSDTEVDAAIAHYLVALEQHTRAATTVRVHAGVETVLAAVLKLPRCAVGLGTGNVRRGAELKLTPVRLFEQFAFGGFGCDHVDRAELLRIGAQRGARRLDEPLASCRVVVIGDTPKDVHAAHAIGAECVAVSTGAATAAELREAGARHVFADLTDPSALAVLSDRA